MTQASDNGLGSAAIPAGAADYIQHVEAVARDGGLAPLARIAYGPQPGQQLEVHAPAGAAGLPVLLFFHGGAWIRGGLPWLRFMAPAVLAQPAVFVAGTYRLAPDTRWPGQYHDVCTALRFVQQHAADWGGDATRIVVGGHSAGGHLSALAVLKRELPPVQGCVPVSGTCDVRYGDVDLESEAGRVYKYLLEHRSQDAEASPVLFAEGNRVPFHLMWGSDDFERIRRSNEAMVSALQRAGAPVTSQVLDGVGHFETHLALTDASHPWYARVRALWQGDRAAQPLDGGRDR